MLKHSRLSVLLAQVQQRFKLESSECAYPLLYQSKMYLSPLKTVVEKYKGIYKESNEKRVPWIHGTYISQQVEGFFEYKGMDVSVFMYLDKGVKDSYDIQGSPYRIMVRLHKYVDLQIYPANFWDTLIFRLGLFKGAKLGNKYIKSSNKVIGLIKNNPPLINNLAQLNFGMYTSKDDKGSARLMLRPNQSILEERDLMRFINLATDVARLEVFQES